VDPTALALIMSELPSRLAKLFQQDSSFKFSVPDSIQVAPLFEAIDEHHGVRVSIEKLKKVLEDRSVQFRLIQKKLLSRFKDKNPSPLNSLDLLLHDTYQSIVDTASAVE